MSEIESLLKKGQTCMNLGNPKEAMIIYNQILKQDPLQIQALLKKGHILGQLARYEQAIISYDAVLEQDIGNLLAFLNKGLAHHFLGQYDIAISCYDMVLKEKPQNPTALYNKASSFVKSGRVNQGLEILAKAIKFDHSLKEKAEHDYDFQEVKNTNEFKEKILKL